MVFYNTCLLFSLFSVQTQGAFYYPLEAISDGLHPMGPFLGPLGPVANLGPDLQCLPQSIAMCHNENEDKAQCF